MPKRKELQSELAGKPVAELRNLLSTSREELRDLRFRVAADQHKDLREIREVRHRIARILTVLHAKKPAVAMERKT